MKGLAILIFEFSFIISLFVLMLVFLDKVMLKVSFDSLSYEHGVLHYRTEGFYYVLNAVSSRLLFHIEIYS
jgi:hypothetical protein